MKSALKKIIDVLTIVFASIGVFFSAIKIAEKRYKKSVLTMDDGMEKNAKAEAAAIKKEKEIEEKTGTELINESCDAVTHLERIAEERDDFRERVRNRLNQNLPG